MDKIAAYKDLLKVVKKHADAFDEHFLPSSVDEVKSRINALEVSEKFGIPLQDSQTGTWLRVKNVYDDWTALGLFGETHGRTISWSDNGKQPKNEWLFQIAFPCGAYTFGGDALWNKDYPVKTFKAFFEELKSYGVAYCDTVNHKLYFNETSAKAVYEDFWDVFNKYKALVSEEIKEQRKQELKAELDRLK